MPNIKNKLFTRQLNNLPQTEEIQEQDKLYMRFPPNDAMKPQREPFAKNMFAGKTYFSTIFCSPPPPTIIHCLFTGKFDMEMLTYPEPQNDERFEKYSEWFKIVEEFIKDNIERKSLKGPELLPPEYIEKFKELGVFRSLVPEVYEGYNFSSTEYLRLVELLSFTPLIGNYFTKQWVRPIEIMKRFATADQKARYFPKIAIGEYLPIVVDTENSTREMPKFNKVAAAPTFDKKHWVLNGTATIGNNLVDPNLYIVVSPQGKGTMLNFDLQILSFIVPKTEKNAETIKEKRVTRYGLQMLEVIFDNTYVPVEDAIPALDCDSHDVVIDMLTTGNLNVAARCIGILRCFFNILVDQMIKGNNFGKPMHEFSYVQDAVARIATSLYGMESMTYMTAGIIDMYKDQDVTVERAMCELYCVDECVKSIRLGLSLLTTTDHFQEDSYEQVLREAASLLINDRSMMNTDLLIGMFGIKTNGLKWAENIKQWRNPLDNPLIKLKNVLFPKGEKTQLLGLEHMVHPSLQRAAELLDAGILKLSICSQNILIKHGVSQLEDAHPQMRRVTEMATLCYLFTCLMARASRSYCTGHRNAEEERNFVNSITYKIFTRIDALEDEMTDNDFLTGDYSNKQIAKTCFKIDRYSLAHPNDRNV